VRGKRWYQADAVAASYDATRFTGGGQIIDAREKRAVLDALESASGKRVLEIACGTGRFTAAMAAAGATVTAFDISSAMMRRAASRVDQAGHSESVEFIRGDGARLPFGTDSFDAVVAMRFFHLTDTPQQYLREMARVSTDRVIFDTFNQRSARELYTWMLPMGSRLYSREEVHDLTSSAGLKIVSAEDDFVLPYGLYRQLSEPTARAIRRSVASVRSSPIGGRFASVTYWQTRCHDG
jgi:Methylase involved in ubiquinone/menaquinone biosynthesis